ncbi:MAG: GNAT family N-acetyltransferase [Bacteroidetes bacterium]|nr:GNAT family N-acetyltransferase [Bacteroidota bacterium]
MRFIIEVGRADHAFLAQRICESIEEAARARGTGIARRTPEYVIAKLREGKAVIAYAVTDGSEERVFAGFCYIESWGGKKYVANSGLIVRPEFRHSGLARDIKRRAFELSREQFPGAKLFGITTSHAVMKINTDLGYVPVPFSELTDDDEFWGGCRSCPNVDILERMQRRMCLCTGMLYDPADPRTRMREAIHNHLVTIELPNAEDMPDAPPRVRRESHIMEHEVFDV